METSVTVVGLRSRSVGRSHINRWPCSAYCSSIRIFQIFAWTRAFYRIIRHSYTNKTPTSLQACAEVMISDRNGVQIAIPFESEERTILLLLLHRPWAHKDLAKAAHIFPKKRRSQQMEKRTFGLEAEHELFFGNLHHRNCDSVC